MIRMTIIASALLLSACADNAQNDFLCPAQEGSPCTSISQADGAGGAGRTLVSERAEDRLADTLTQEPLGIGKSGPTQFAGMPDGGFPYQTSRYRVPELVGRIWIAPYHDENEILHESRYIHAVMVEAHWRDR